MAALPSAAATSTMPPLLMVLCMLLLAATDTSTMWRKALVTQGQLTAASRSQTLQAAEDTVCAIHATNTPWSHLFTHNASGCVL